ncbi:MAG TPA: hypothetical protein PLB34_18095, partial [Rhodoblastus sp.]|nr:hypothetical protein [Rhodoblastus sp.]
TYEAGQVETIHALDWIKRTIGEDGLRERAKGKLKGLKIANYYGCMYTRPRNIFPGRDAGPESESSTKPHYMDDLLAAAGAENVDFPLKTACCGGAHTLSDSDTSTKLCANILRAATSFRCGRNCPCVSPISRIARARPNSRPAKNPPSRKSAVRSAPSRRRRRLNAR